jgi:hypothetical protein
MGETKSSVPFAPSIVNEQTGLMSRPSHHGHRDGLYGGEKSLRRQAIGILKQLAEGLAAAHKLPQDRPLRGVHWASASISAGGA